MERNHSIFAVVTAACFIALCCDGVVASSSSVGSSRSLSSSYSLLNNPFEQQCTWLFRANPNDCRSYFQCLHGRSVLRKCPRKLHWNPEGHYCDYQSRAACRKGSPSLANSVLEVYDNNRAHIRGKYREPCPANLHKPYPEDCGKFIQCGSNNQVLVMSCPTGLHWDKTHNTCNWPQIANCNPSGSLPGSGPAAVVSDYETTTAQPTLPPFPAFTTTAAPPPPEPIVSSTLQPITTTTTEWTTTTVTTTTTPYTTTKRPTASTSTQSSQTIYPILIPSSEYKIVCYFTNWAVYRRDGGKYTPADIDPSKCTHIIYAFACLNPINYKLEMCDPWIDGKDGKNFYGQITSFRKLGIKVMIAVGGWNDSGYSKWTLMLKDMLKMETFITSVCDFLKLYEFDGFDVDYEYPACPQANCNFDAKFEKQAFTTLIKGLRLKCGPQTILSAAVSCNENIVKEAYDVPTLSKYLDIINLMAYDFHGAWEPKTGINAPHKQTHQDEPHLNVEHAVSVFLSLGATPEKLFLGMPMYGQSFTVADRMGGHSIGVKSSAPGRAGPSTNQKGMLAYYEICNQTWTVTVKDKENRVGPYGYDMDDGTWVSYDDREYIHAKSNYVKEMKLGGAMIWSLDFDDFKNICGQGNYPLLSAINESLRGPPATLPKQINQNRKRVTTSSSNNNKRSSSNQANSNRRQSKNSRS